SASVLLLASCSCVQSDICSSFSHGPPQPFTLFPYTTLFRSWGDLRNVRYRPRPNRLDEWRPRRPRTLSTLPSQLSATLRSTGPRSEEHTSELQSHLNLVCRLLLEKKKTHTHSPTPNESLRLT